MRATRVLLTISTLLLINSSDLIAQDDLENVEYSIIAQGNKSPLNDVAMVCFNKYFNLESLSEEFRQANNLDDKSLYKKKMLIEIFLGERTRGADSIKLTKIAQNDNELIVAYETIDSDTSDFDNRPYLIIQIPKIKKSIVLFENGKQRGGQRELYIDN
ncbi:hypothetical protein [Ekhidna sp.]|uniref:hypothetical protein n=1 Tax=Ekhidna sp. TaxID=2608089 RepID=UPI003B5B9F7D